MVLIRATRVFEQSQKHENHKFKKELMAYGAVAAAAESKTKRGWFRQRGIGKSSAGDNELAPPYHTAYGLAKRLVWAANLALKP